MPCLPSMDKITPEDDAELSIVKAQVLEIANPSTLATNKDHHLYGFRRYRRLPDANLAPSCWHSSNSIAPGDGYRLAQVHAQEELRLPELLTLFSPRSKSKAQALPQEPAEIDLLSVRTAYPKARTFRRLRLPDRDDIHWNPVRHHSALWACGSDRLA